MKVELRVRRFDPTPGAAGGGAPSAPGAVAGSGAAGVARWDTFDLEADPGDRVLDLLHQVRWNLDGTLAFRRSCAHGVCGSDAMVVNGVNRLACVLLVGDVGPRITVEPLRGLPVLKDLVVDMEPFFEGWRRVMPHLVANDGDDGGGDVVVEGGVREAEPVRERRQSPDERARYDDTTKCILCAACTTSCPVFWSNDSYVGPAAIVNAHRFVFDSRDTAAEARLEILDNADGVWRCRTAFNCTEACPRGIEVTEAIAEIKRAITAPRPD